MPGAAAGAVDVDGVLLVFAGVVAAPEAGAAPDAGAALVAGAAEPAVTWVVGAVCVVAAGLAVESAGCAGCADSAEPQAISPHVSPTVEAMVANVFVIIPRGIAARAIIV